MKRSNVLLNLAVVLIAAMGSIANADVINVAINSEVSGEYGTGSGQLLAPAPYDGSVWNANATASGSDLLDSEGNATTIGYSTSGILGGGGTAANEWMQVMEGYLCITPSDWSGLSSGEYMEFTITGLTVGKDYDLHMILQGNGGDGGLVTMFDGADNLPESAQSLGDTSRLTVESYIEGRNFASQSWTANCTTATFGIGQVPGGKDPYYACLNGFQIVEVPEPATMALLGLGTLGLIRRRRK